MKGSRAMEVVILVRGECEMIQEKIDPISRKSQAYRVGRFGPTSILSSAEYVKTRKCRDFHSSEWIGRAPESLLTSF